MIDLKIVDNFLEENNFRELEEFIHGANPCWNFSPKLNPDSTDENAFQFFHWWMKGGDLSYKGAEYYPKIILNQYLKNEKSKKVRLMHARANFFIRSSNKQLGLGYHKDIYDTEYCTTLLLYLQDSDGCTQFKETKEKVISKRNRALIFPSHLEHQTVSHTNTLFRTNINLNFVKDVNEST